MTENIHSHNAQSVDYIHTVYLGSKFCRVNTHVLFAYHSYFILLSTVCDGKCEFILGNFFEPLCCV